MPAAEQRAVAVRDVSLYQQAIPAVSRALRVRVVSRVRQVQAVRLVSPVRRATEAVVRPETAVPLPVDKMTINRYNEISAPQVR